MLDPIEAIRLGGPLANSDPTSVSSTAAANKPKRKPIRRDPEKRRLQNIQAQKRHREKLKRRLDDLEAIAGRLAERRNNTTTISTDEDTPPASGSQDPSTSPAGVAHQQPSANVDFYDCDNLDPTSTYSRPAPPLTRKSKCSLGRMTAWEPEPEPDAVPDLFAPWDTTTIVDPSHLILSSNTSIATTDKKTEPVFTEPPEQGKWFTSYIDCGCPARHVQLRRLRPYGAVEALHFVDVGGSGEEKSRELVHKTTPSLPDPYANHIWMTKECVVAAMWSNCLQLGISDATFCDEDAQSPFYREAPARKWNNNNNLFYSLPDTSGEWSLAGLGVGSLKEHADDGVVHTVQSIFKTLKPDLRPTREQITIPHHPFFDIFPFPTFRRNVLRSETVVDEDELCNDIIAGLICWGGAGVGKRDRNNNNSTAGNHLSSGAPWDHRSWEAKPWFLRKYWLLLGGEEGELVRQSEWWRGVRGEEEDLWPVKLALW